MSYGLLADTDTFHITISRPFAARTLAVFLVDSSVEFHCEPLPDEETDFTVKAEAANQLARLAADAEREADLA